MWLLITKKHVTCRWKCDTASPLYDISSALAPFLISGKSDMASRTVIVRYGAEVIRVTQLSNCNDIKRVFHRLGQQWKTWPVNFHIITTKTTAIYSHTVAPTHLIFFSIFIGSHLDYANSLLFATTQKTSCGAGHNKPHPGLPHSERPKTTISLHSQSLGGSTGLPEDHNQTK